MVKVAKENFHTSAGKKSDYFVEKGGKIFFHFISKKARLSRKKIGHKMCVLIFVTTFFSEIFSTLRRTDRDEIKNVHKSLSEVPVILVRF
jgi:hypothetical protein